MIRDHLKVHILIDHGGKDSSPTNPPALEPDTRRSRQPLKGSNIKKLYPKTKTPCKTD